MFQASDDRFWHLQARHSETSLQARRILVGLKTRHCQLRKQSGAITSVRRTLDAATLIHPLLQTTIRPAKCAFWIARRARPEWAEYSRSDIPSMAFGGTYWQYFKILELNENSTTIQSIALPDRDAVMGGSLSDPAFCCAVHHGPGTVLSLPTIPVGGADPKGRTRPWITLLALTYRWTVALSVS